MPSWFNMNVSVRHTVPFPQDTAARQASKSVTTLLFMSVYVNFTYLGYQFLEF